MYNNIKNILKENHITFEEYDHEPILSFEKAKEIREKLQYTGVESKSLFIKDRSGNYYIFVTTEGKIRFKNYKKCFRWKSIYMFKRRINTKNTMFAWMCISFWI